MKKYNEQRYYEEAIFYADFLHNDAQTMFYPINHQKTWLMFAGLIESANIVEYNNE